MSATIRSDAESTDFEAVSYHAVKPRRRDFLRVLLGRFEPEVRRETRVTAKGAERVLRDVFTSEKLEKQFYDDSPFLDLLR